MAVLFGSVHCKILGHMDMGAAPAFHKLQFTRRRKFGMFNAEGRALSLPAHVSVRLCC